MKKSPLIVLCILYILQANAQSKKSTELILSYNSKLYFNEKNMQYREVEIKGITGLNLFAWNYIKSEHWFDGVMRYTNEIKLCP